MTKRISHNPLADLKGVLKPHRTKNYPAIRINELPALMAKLEDLKTPKINKLAIKMLLLTFVRQGELRKTKWQHFDFDKKLWCIPAELMKMRKEHVVPLSSQTLNLLNKIKEIYGSGEYLFPTKHKMKHPYMNENVINNVLHSLGYKGKLVGHGFRSLASPP